MKTKSMQEEHTFWKILACCKLYTQILIKGVFYIAKTSTFSEKNFLLEKL